MTGGQRKPPLGWMAFFLRATVLTTVLFAALVVPYRRWIGGDALPVLGLAAGLELFLIGVSYALLRRSFDASSSSQYSAILGGWAIRFGPTIAALFVLWNWTDLPDTAVTVAILVFYLALLFYEALISWKV